MSAQKAKSKATKIVTRAQLMRVEMKLRRRIVDAVKSLIASVSASEGEIRLKWSHWGGEFKLDFNRRLRPDVYGWSNALPEKQDTPAKKGRQSA